MAPVTATICGDPIATLGIRREGGGFIVARPRRDLRARCQEAVEVSLGEMHPVRDMGSEALVAMPPKVRVRLVEDVPCPESKGGRSVSGT